MKMSSEKTINEFKTLLQNEANLYYGKAIIQNKIREDVDFDFVGVAEYLSNWLNKYPKEEYLKLILGIVCGERVRRDNLKTITDEDVGILGSSYNDNVEILNNLLFEEYSKYLRYPNVNTETKAELYKKWLKIISGSLDHVNVIRNPNETIIYYSDHVSRMQKILSATNKIEQLQKFTIPQFETDDFIVLNIDDIVKTTKIGIIPKELRRELNSFNYENLENTKEGHVPILLDLKFNDFNGGSTFLKDCDNECDQIRVSCLHMPIKISKAFADNFNSEGRRDPRGNEYDHNCLYIPKEFAKKDMIDLLKYSIASEALINRERLDTNFVLLTFRTDNLKINESLGKTGWHIDGHQGVERIQKDGNKVPIDRVYCVSNIMPTQYTDIRLDLSAIRNLASKEHLTIDQYNIQSIIEQTVQKAQNEQGISVIHEAPKNVVFYANPYVIHQSQVNRAIEPIERHFARVLFSVDERDRIGDTVSPIFGPIYPFKIKQIIDIKQPPQDVDFYNYTYVNSN